MKYLNRTIVTWTVVLFSITIWAILAFWSAVPFAETLKLVKLLPDVVTADCIGFGFFVAYGWKWRIFQRWLVPFPDLNGTWQGTIQTTWQNPKTGERPGPIPVMLAIKQSFVSISCVMRTKEMTSNSYAADFVLNDDEQIRQLVYTYRSNPRPTVQDRSPIHEGTIVFDIAGSPPQKMAGRYWTGRSTTGEVFLTFQTKQRLEELPENFGPHPVSGPA